jgi:hypothetical protein
MATQTLSTIGIEPSDDFPIEPYESINTIMRTKKDSHPELWAEYAAAWNGLAYRFCSCAQHDIAFTKSIQRFGAFPEKRPEKYNQEHNLFGFFVAGQSVIECFCYGLFAIASIVKTTYFPMGTPEQISPEMTKDKFNSRKGFPNEAISKALKQIVDDQDYQDWKATRNTLIHRQAPGRILHMGGPNHGDTFWVKDILLDADTTALRRRWLVKNLSNLLNVAEAFTSIHLRTYAERKSATLEI